MDMNGSTFEGTFQSTLPRRERPQLSRNFRDVAPISIHAPAKGATKQHRSTQPPNSYFNPRSREGSDQTIHLCRVYILIISIHAPAKGATSEADEAVKLSHISIHAPAKGATRTVPHSGG